MGLSLTKRVEGNRARLPHSMIHLKMKHKTNYISAEILLLRGDEMVRGNLVARSHHANQNMMGRAHLNSILDSRVYPVKISGDKVTILTANIISSQYTPSVMQTGMSTHSYPKCAS